MHVAVGRVPLFVWLIVGIAAFVLVLLIFGGEAVGPFGTWGG